MKKIPVLMLLFMILFMTATASASLDARREVLQSGMILLHSERTALPIVSVVVAIRAGSIAEPYEKAGLSNLTVELLNEGTKKRTSKDISNAIEYVGGALGTSGGNDFVTVSLTVLKKDIELGFDLLSDIILNPAFSEDEVGRIKALLRSGIIRQKEEPGAIASKEFAKRIYGKHPYGTPLEGTEESLAAITREDIVRFHDALYAPNNATLAATGDIGADEIRSLISRYFGSWKPKQIGTGLPSPPSSGETIQSVKLQKNTTQAHIMLGHLGITRDNPDYYAVSVMNYILGGGGFASRLMDNIRDNKGLSYDVYSYFSARRYAGGFQAGLQTKTESANLAIGEILREIEKIRTEKVTDGELSDAKSYLKGSFPLRIDSISEIATFLVNCEFYGLGLDYAEKYRGFIDSVTAEEILQAAGKYLHPDKYVLVVVGNIEKMDLRY